MKIEPTYEQKRREKEKKKKKKKEYQKKEEKYERCRVTNNYVELSLNMKALLLNMRKETK